MSTVAEIHWRLVETFADWPYPLGRLVDTSLSLDERLDIARRFIKAFACCLDSYFGSKIHSSYMTPEEMLNDAELMDIIRTWVRKSRICNMHLERMLALVRRSTPDKCPNSERVSAAALLRLVLEEHLKAGGSHPGAFQRADVALEGVPLTANVAPSKSVPERARGHWLYIRQRVSDVKKASGSKRLPKVEIRAVRQRAMAEFRELPQG